MWLRSLGMPTNRVVILERGVANTHDEAVAVAAYARRHPIRRLVVVTSPYHARRAWAVFRAVLGSTVQVGVRSATAESPARPDSWWWAAYDRNYVPYEWAALAWYALRYGVNPLIGPPEVAAIPSVSSTRNR
jgi:uncharacterized SAM-binding protein YcdF (DUF218 family)